MCVYAKNQHKDAPLYLVGNDFGSMLSLYSLVKFPGAVDKMAIVGWGAPRGQDFGFLFTSWLKKLFLYDNGISKLGHISKNKRFAFRFEKGRYAWLSSDAEQVKKIIDAKYINEAGTIGHYFYYFYNKVKTPCFMRMKKVNKDMPILFVSGNQDLLTKKGRTTKALAKHYKMRGFSNIETMIVNGRHELFFEKNRFEFVDKLISGLTSCEVKHERPETKEVTKVEVIAKEELVDVEVVGVIEEPTIEKIIKGENNQTYAFMEAEEDLLINTNKESE